MTTTFSSLAGKRVLVTGGNGFLGRHLCDVLSREGATAIVPYRGDPPGIVDLRVIGDVQGMFSNMLRDGLDCVFHLAGYNGGLLFNERFPVRIFHDNTIMALNLFETARLFGINRIVSVVASCAYPALQLSVEPGYEDVEDAVHFFQQRELCPEEQFLDGPPDVSVECHAYAKRNILLASQFYNQQYGTHYSCVCPTTLYGPGDSTHPARSKVVGGMVMRFLEAKQKGLSSVRCWGDGTPKRELMYVKDCAELLARSLDFEEDLVNLGSGMELTIRELAERVAQSVGYTGNIEWDTSRPNGQPRKLLSSERMTEYIGEYAFTPFEEALTETVKYYREQETTE